MNLELLINKGGKLKKYSKGEYLFRQGESPKYLHILVSGKIKVFTLNKEGKEFTHQVFVGESFIGIPPIIIDEKYPSNAIVLRESEVIRINKECYYSAADANSNLYKGLLEELCLLHYHKSVMSSEISLHTPEHRILTLFKHVKEEDDIEMINLTRQEIADKVALRIETVIRAIKKLENKGILSIVKGKIYY